MPLEVARVHAEEVRGEERGFVPARAGPDLDDRVPLIQGIVRDEERLEPFLRARDRGLEARHFLARFGRHLGVVNGNELAGVRELVFFLLETRRQLDQRRQSSVFTPKLGEPPGVL
jgi:hypothetical protein